MRQITYLFTTIVIFIILALLPIIPVVSAPVVPNPVEELTWVSLWQILFNFPQPGLEIQLKWYSWLVILLLVGVEFFIRRFIVYKFFMERKQNDKD